MITLDKASLLNVLRTHKGTLERRRCFPVKAKYVARWREPGCAYVLEGEVSEGVVAKLLADGQLIVASVADEGDSIEYELAPPPAPGPALHQEVLFDLTPYGRRKG